MDEDRAARAIVSGPRLLGDRVWVPAPCWANAVRADSPFPRLYPPTEPGAVREYLKFIVDAPSAVAVSVEAREIVHGETWVLCQQPGGARSRAWVPERALDPVIRATIAQVAHAQAEDIECLRSHCPDAVSEWTRHHEQAMEIACADASAHRAEMRVDAAVASIAATVEDLDVVASAVALQNEDRHLLLHHVVPLIGAECLGPAVQELLADCIAHRVLRQWTEAFYGARPTTVCDARSHVTRAQDEIRRAAHSWVHGTGPGRVYGGITLAKAERGETPWDVILPDHSL